MRIATYNVNGINGRLPNLLPWLAEAAPDIVCLQELKAPDEKFPATAIRSAGYGSIWHGQKSWNGVAILARGAEPMETRRGLPGDPDDTHSRYIEAAIDGIIVGCLYLPNGNPVPGPKFDYKLRWFERLMDTPKASLRATNGSCSRAIITLCRPILMCTPPNAGLMTRCFGRRCGMPTGVSLRRDGRTPPESCIRESASTLSGTIGETPLPGMRVYASTICC